MQILTSSIKQFIKYNFHKDINKIGYQDLLSIEGITIDQFDENNQKQKIDFNELKMLKNLKYLEIRNLIISNYMIEVLEKMDYLENIIFRNCTFRTTIKTLNNIKPLNQLRIENCKNFNFDFISEIKINYLILGNIIINNLNILKKELVNVLDISTAIVENKVNFNLKIKKLVISHNDNIRFKNKLKNRNYQIVTMANNGFYIEI